MIDMQTKRLRNTLAWTGVALMALLLVLLAIVIVLNAFDEKLDSRAAAFGEPRKSLVQDENNGYFALLALNANPGEDSMAYARAWVTESRAATMENRPEKRVDRKREQRDEVCDSAQDKCAITTNTETEKARSVLRAYQEDLERYERLLSMRHYEEVLDYRLRVSSALPPYKYFIETQKAYLMCAAVFAQSGDMGGALAAISRDLAFQRVMLAGTRTIHGQAIAATAYTRNLAAIFELLRDRKLQVPLHLPILRAMLQPIDATSLQVSKGLEPEFATAKSLLRNPLARSREDRPVSSSDRVAIWLFYKRNATTNRAYEKFMAAATPTSMSAQLLVQDRKAVEQSKQHRNLWNYVNNPIGNRVIDAVTPDFRDFALRLHDLDAFNRLLGLWVECVAAGTSHENAEKFIANADQRFHDPYTGKPMQWDAEKKRIFFDAQGNFAKNKMAGMNNGGVFVTP